MTTLGWTSILVLAGGAYAFKVLGLLLGGRVASRALGVVALLPAALLPALVVVNTFAAAGDGRTLVVDARAAGMAVALAAAWRRAPFVVIVVLAAAVTALVRAVS